MVASARGSRAFVVAAIMASMFMIAIETTIVSTAMPLIVAQLGGMDIYAWVFAVFLLAQTASAFDNVPRFRVLKQGGLQAPKPVIVEVVLAQALERG